MKLTAEEKRFLEWVGNGCPRPGILANRAQDKARQSLRRRGLVECVMQPRRWVITDAGRAALDDEDE